MRGSALSGIDLNLLMALDALLSEHHVTRAARKVGLSQSAMSRALARLRDVFGDPLLVRGQRGMLPTARASALRAPLAAALQHLERVFRERDTFEPSQAIRRVRILGEDYAEAVLMPGLLARIRREAPGVDLDLAPRGSDPAASLRSGDADLLIGVAADYPGLYRQELFSEDFACLVRSGHPQIRERISLKQYCALGHIVVSVRPEFPGPVNAALEARGLSRRVVLRLAHFVAAPWIVAETDLVLTLARRLAQRYAESLSLRLVSPPLALRRFVVQMDWHERSSHDPAHQWLRRVVNEEAARPEA